MFLEFLAVAKESARQQYSEIRAVSFYCTLNSSPIDERGNWYLEIWWGTYASPGKQGDNHGNPASRNPPPPHPALPGTVTLRTQWNKIILTNPYSYLPANMVSAGRVGWDKNPQRFAKVKPVIRKDQHE